MTSRELISSILVRYSLPWTGTHGVPHWARVLENGRRLSKMTGAKIHVVELFAVFHDSRRINEETDDGHGRRGAQLAKELRGIVYELEAEDFGLLTQACDLHTEGYLGGDITLQTCWDADRLDLWRVHIVPDASILCTSAAKNDTLLEWARKRSLSDHVPRFVTDHWLRK